MNGLVSILLFTPDRNRAVTQRAWKSLIKYADAAHEIIIDDDKSPDWTITRAINRAVAKSRGDYILIFNDDCEATPHFLSKLVDVMEGDPRIGVVGCKILYLGGVYHGLIQHPGLMLYRDGTATPWPRCCADDARFNFVRDIVGGYIQGSCYLIRRIAFYDVGGVDEIYGRGMYDETDLCLKMTRKGWRVLYAPVDIYHGIGGESTVTNQASRSLYERNRRIFAKRYGRYLPPRPRRSLRENLYLGWRRSLWLRRRTPIRVRHLLKRGIARLPFISSMFRHRLVEFEDHIWVKEVGFATQYLSWEDVVLDLGCGKRITVAGAIGVDLTLSPQSVGVQGTQRPTLLCEGQVLPFQDESIGYVTSIHSFEHFPEPLKVLSEIHRVLKPGGYVGLVIPRHDLTPKRPDHVAEYMPDSFERLVEGSGLRVVAREDCIENWSFGMLVQK